MSISRAALRTVVGLAKGSRRFSLDRCSAALHRFTIVLNGCSAVRDRFFSDLHPPMARLRRRTAILNACIFALRGRSAQVRGQTGRCSGTMTTVPRTDVAAIEFFRTHIEAWQHEPELLGLTPDEVLAMKSATVAAAAARAEAERIRQTAEAATLIFREAMQEMRRTGALVLARIRAKSQSAGGTAVLAKAEIPPASTRRAPLPPARPENVQTSIEGGGSIRLKWKVRHTMETRAGGSVYTIERREMRANGGPGAWTMIGATSGGGTSQSFIDEAPPAASTSVSGVAYRITARRAGIIGPASDIVTVFYGGGRGVAAGGAGGDGAARAA